MLLGAAVACGHARPAAPTGVERALADRLEGIAYEGEGKAVVAGVKLERTTAGAIRAEAQDAPPPADLPAERDVTTEASIRGKLSTDPMLAATNLDVDVDDGVVRLSGDLVGPEQAARAVTIALAEPGVRAVESRCSWIPEQDHLRLVGKPAPRRH